MAKVFIGVGHGGSDPGAVGIVKEAQANLVTALEMRRVLQERGVSVGISRTVDEDDGLTEEINECNAFGPDLAVEVHNNAGGGDGFECYIQTNGYAARSKALGQRIEAEVKALGQGSRGLKTKLGSSGADYFGWLRLCRCPAVLCEGFFVDSGDAYGFDTEAEQKALGRAYAQGVIADLEANGLLEEVKEMAKFTDVKDSAWYAEAVDYCAEHGLVNGDGDGKFRPDAPITRAEMAAVAMRLHEKMSK